MRNPTRNYRTTGYSYSSLFAYQATGEPFFTWNDVLLMIRDGAVSFGELTLRTAFQGVKIAQDKDGEDKIDAPPRVKEYIKRTFKTFWRASAPKLLQNYFRWGRAPGGNEWIDGDGALELDQVRAIEPFDATALVWKKGMPREGQFAGYRLRASFETVNVGPGYAFWFCGKEALGPFVDAPRLMPAFAPWLQKTAPMGLLNARRLHAWTQAVGITVIRHPGGDVPLPDGSTMPAENKATQIGMLLQNGSIVALPSKMIPGANGSSPAYEWDIDQREPRTGGKDIGESVKDVDGEIWFAMGIPTEVIRAQMSGSGFSGRSIPMETFLGGSDEIALMLDRAFRVQTLHYGIKKSFGKVPWDYEINSLLEEFREQNKSGPREPGQGTTAEAAQPAGGADQSSGFRPDGWTKGGNQRLVNGQGDRRYAPRSSASLSGLSSDVIRKDRDIDKKTALLHSAAALAMIEHRLHELTTGEEDEEGDDIRASIAHLIDDPEEVAAALGGVALSWIDYGKSRGGKQRWKDEATKRVRYQDTQPGTRSAERKKNQGTAAKGHAIIDKVTRYAATPADLAELVDHIPAMTVADLRAARAKLGARFKSGAQRDAMVKALQDHVHGKRKEVETIAGEQGSKGPKLRENGTPESPKIEDVHTVHPSALKRKPELMQYKVSGIKADGVTDELKGVKEYKPELGGTLLAWRDPETGEDIVVNGHHRHELADRAGASSVNARWLPVKTAKEARAVGAIANIAEGRGTATDAAKLLRDSGMTLDDLQKAGVSLSGRIAADAGALKDLSDGSFAKLVQGTLNEQTATAVARHLKDPKLQDMLFRKLDKREEDGKDWSTREIEQAARKMAAAGKTTVSGLDLFGDWEDEQSTFDQEVELESHVGRALAQAVNDFAAVSNVKRADRVSDAGNVLAVEENQRRRATAEAQQATFAQLVNRSGPIAEAIKQSAGELASAKSKKEKDRVRTEAIDRVRSAIGKELGSVPVERRGESERPANGGNGAEVPADTTPSQPADVTETKPAESSVKNDPIFTLPNPLGGDDIPYFAVNKTPDVPAGHTVLESKVIPRKNGESHRLSVVKNADGDFYTLVEKSRELEGSFDKVVQQFTPADATETDNTYRKFPDLERLAKKMHADYASPSLAEPRGTNLFGDRDAPTWRAPKGNQLSIEDAARDAWTNHAEAHAQAAGKPIEAYDAGGRFKMGGVWHQVGKAEDGFPIATVDSKLDATPLTDAQRGTPDVPADPIAHAEELKAALKTMTPEQIDAATTHFESLTPEQIKAVAQTMHLTSAVMTGKPATWPAKLRAGMKDRAKFHQESNAPPVEHVPNNPQVAAMHDSLKPHVEKAGREKLPQEDVEKAIVEADKLSTDDLKNLVLMVTNVKVANRAEALRELRGKLTVYKRLVESQDA